MTLQKAPVEMLNSLEAQKRLHARIAPPPRQGGLEKGTAERLEVRTRDRLAFRVAGLRQAQPQVHRGDVALSRREAPDQSAEASAERHLQSIGQPHKRAHNEKSDPGRPVSG